MQTKLHVVVVSNHWGVKTSTPSAGIFVDRQIASLERVGVRISTFDIGASHSPIQIVKKWLELCRLVRRLNPDLVHAQYGTITGFVSTFVSKPAVISYCGNDLRAGASVSNVRMCLGICLSNMAALRARALICKSTQLRQALWWRRHRAIVIPSGIDLELFTPGPRDIARKQLGWDERNPIVILNVRNDPTNKGLDLAMKAMQIVRSRISEAELRLIENIEPERMPLCYRAADVLLCASLSEGSPNVVKEALACNLPVVSTPVGDVPERLAGVQPSTVVLRDAEAIGEALVKTLLERKRSNGREHVATLSMENVAQRVLDVYQAALGDRFHSEFGVSMHLAKKLTIVPIAEGAMLDDVAELHLDAFAGFVNTLLGRGYVKSFVTWFIRNKGTMALAAIDENQKLVGYALAAPVGYSSRLNRDLYLVTIARILVRPWLIFNPRFRSIVMERVRSLVGQRQNASQTLELPGPSMSLVAIGVASDQRRGKIGQRLMQAVEAGACRLQMRSLVLSVYESATTTRRFYEQCGWQLCPGIETKGNVLKYCRLLRETPNIAACSEDVQ
ncbi:MAG: GNAT family N-acetyltransferase [Nitrospira sp. BO4]|jgi:glycosyltransferase involved in cell wall biosynthesis/ribosomal protein S18 acetylase RimI-like enzyme|nr:GNAT family N-acetyltransferase [Nitrospira sp. BO4]